MSIVSFFDGLGCLLDFGLSLNVSGLAFFYGLLGFSEGFRRFVLAFGGLLLASLGLGDGGLALAGGLAALEVSHHSGSSLDATGVGRLLLARRPLLEGLPCLG